MKEITKEYKVGKKRQHTSLIKTTTRTGDIDEFVESNNKEYSNDYLISDLIRFFTEYLESRGVDSDYKGAWTCSGEKINCKEKSIDGKKENEAEFKKILRIKGVSTYVGFIEKHYKNDRGVVIAARGLREIMSAQSAMQSGNHEKAITHILKAGNASRIVVVADMEAQWHAGKSRVSEAHAERKSLTDQRKEKALELYREKKGLPRYARWSDSAISERIAEELELHPSTVRRYLNGVK